MFPETVGCRRWAWLVAVSVVALVALTPQSASAAGVEITPRPWYRHYDRYNYGNDWYYGKPSDYDAYYNFRFGRMTLAMTARLAARWSDNNNYGTNDKRAGWSLIPELTLAVNYPVSPYVTIDTSLSVGYRYYPNSDTGESDFFLSADAGTVAAGVGGTIILGDNHFIRIHDRLTFETETLSAETYYYTDNDTQDWGSWRNVLNATYGRQLHPDWRTNITLAYEVRRVTNSDFKYLDFDKYSADWVLYWNAVRRVSLGPYVRYEYYDFRTDERNDRDLVEVGFTADVTDGFGIAGLSYTVNGGYEIMNSTSDGVARDEGGNFTANFTTRYQPTVFPGHRVRASFRRNHEDPSPAVNYADELLLGYGIDVKATDEVIFTVDLDWLDVRESDQGDHFQMWRFWSTANYWLTRQTTLSLRYSFTSKYSTEGGMNDYDKNDVELSVTHRF